MVFEKLRKALAEQFDAPDITRDTDIARDLGADSLDLVELVMSFEEEYGITVTDETIYQKKTVGEIADYIESLLENM